MTVPLQRQAVLVLRHILWDHVDQIDFITSKRNQACVSFNITLISFDFIFDFMQKQITTTYLVQASVSPSVCQNVPHRILARHEGHKLIQLRAGSHVPLQCFSLSACV